MRTTLTRITTLCAAAVLLYALPVKSQTLDGRELLTLSGNAAVASFDVAGGALVAFHRTGSGVNPFTWNYPAERTTEPRPMGHFICFDRWGQPSAAEQEHGMPFHGEATSVRWQVDRTPSRTGSTVSAAMSCHLPIGGLTLDRSIRLHDSAPVMEVTETITNKNPLGRIYNIVQHPSIAPPFLDEQTLVDCNAWMGHMQENPAPDGPVIYWPEIAYNGRLVDYRTLYDNHNPGVVSFIFSEDISTGWVTAVNPSQGLLVGYIFDTAEYPWLNLWRNVQNGRPAARGLEFGTTGLHRPFPEMVDLKGELLGRPLYEYLDADESTEKSYTVFLLNVPESYRGVDEVIHADGVITVRERETGTTRVIRY